MERRENEIIDRMNSKTAPDSGAQWAQAMEAEAVRFVLERHRVPLMAAALVDGRTVDCGADMADGPPPDAEAVFLSLRASAMAAAGQFGVYSIPGGQLNDGPLKTGAHSMLTLGSAGHAINARLYPVTVDDAGGVNIGAARAINPAHVGGVPTAADAEATLLELGADADEARAALASLGVDKDA